MRRTAFIALLSLAAGTVGCTRGPNDSSIAAHAESPVDVGSLAPTLKAVAHNGQAVDLAELRGKSVSSFG